MKATHLSSILTATLIGATVLATSALAAPSADHAMFSSYYIVLDAESNRCKIVDQKPSPDGVPALGYESRALAERALTEASAWEVPDCSGAPAAGPVATKPNT